MKDIVVNGRVIFLDIVTGREWVAVAVILVVKVNVELAFGSPLLCGTNINEELNRLVVCRLPTLGVARAISVFAVVEFGYKELTEVLDGATLFVATLVSGGLEYTGVVVSGNRKSSRIEDVCMNVVGSSAGENSLLEGSWLVKFTTTVVEEGSS